MRADAETGLSRRVDRQDLYWAISSHSCSAALALAPSTESTAWLSGCNHWGCLCDRQPLYATSSGLFHLFTATL